MTRRPKAGAIAAFAAVAALLAAVPLSGAPAAASAHGTQVAMTAAGSGDGRQDAPASGSQASSSHAVAASMSEQTTSAGLPRGTGKVLSFTLPYLADTVHDPNAQEVAQHAAGDAPLLLFLPATGEVPNNYREFLSTAVSAGFSVLGLDYWNIGKSVTRTCRADASCYTKLQENRYNGTDRSRFSRVGTANSILRRYGAAIAYLEQQDPAGAWGRFLIDHHPAWKRIVLAGHSQGGGESAFLAHFHRVRGVLTYSSPVETYNDVSASWMRTPGRTPPSRMYGFDDVHDVYYARITDSWARLGMGVVDRSAATPVPTGSHVLLSSLDTGTPLEAHGHSVNDFGPRTAKGTMVFAPTWRWMLQQVR